MRSIFIVAFAAVLTACTSVNIPRPSGDFTAFAAVELWRKQELTVVDVRSPKERLRGGPSGVTAVQFGPDAWEEKVSDAEVERFIRELHALKLEPPIALLCQYGVRSESARRALEEKGIIVQSISDGYLGNTHGPGWSAWE